MHHPAGNALVSHNPATQANKPETVGQKVVFDTRIRPTNWTCLQHSGGWVTARMQKKSTTPKMLWVSPTRQTVVSLAVQHRIMRDVKTALIGAAAILGLFTPPAPLWHWPVEGEHAVRRDFQAPLTPWGAGHRGLDVTARPGTTVVAPVSGKVHFSGSVVNRGVITIETAQGWLVSMEPVDIELDRSRVVRGEEIGRVQRGHCAGGCLHIGLRIDGDYRSPARELGILRRATLKPSN